MKENKQGSHLDKKLKTSLELSDTLSKAYHSQTKAYNLFLKRWGLSLPQYSILKQIQRHQRLSQKELAEHLLVSKGNITQLIGKLERAGWIAREQEWKTKYLTLTSSGTVLMNQIEPEQKQFLLQLYQDLTRKEQKMMIRLLQPLVD